MRDNQITDISPLFELSHLWELDIRGNYIPKDDIKKLGSKNPGIFIIEK
jgi:Leucine-rich repeat (LRR) protein